MNKIVNLFLDTDLRNHHEGLAKIAMKKKVDIGGLKPGEHVIFINTSMTYIKMFSASGVLSSKKENKGKINMHSIEMIPEAFDSSGKLNWDKAERMAIEKQFAKYEKAKKTKETTKNAEA